VVAGASGLMQWSFWQEALQAAQSSSAAQQGTAALYGLHLEVLAAYGLLLVAILALLIATANGLFRLPLQYAWLKQAEKLMDRIVVLGVVVIVLLLLSFFVNRAGLLAHTIYRQEATKDARSIVITYNLVLMIALGLFGVIALLRLKSAFGWAERVAMLLSGVVCMLILTGEGRLPKGPLLSSGMQQITDNVFFSLTTNHVIAVCVCLAALISLFWLTRGKSISDRLVPGIVFAIAAIDSLIQYIHTQPVFLLIALILLMQGMLIGSRIERVRQGNIGA